MIILIINVFYLDTVKSAQSKQSTKHEHNIYNKLTSKKKKIIRKQNSKIITKHTMYNYNLIWSYAKD